MKPHRRQFLAALFCLAGARLARAQSAGKRFRIGFLANHTSLADLRKGSGPLHTSHGAFIDGMRRLGWEDGRNIEVHWRSAESDYDRHDMLARELVRMPVDVIVSYSEGVEAAARATKSIPIVMGGHVDPVRRKLVSSLAHPGGNVTGLASSSGADLGKSLSLLKEADPKLSRVALLVHSGPAEWVDRMPDPRLLSSIAKLGPALGLELFFQSCRDGTAIAAAIRGAKFQGAQGIWIEPNFGIYKHPEAARTIADEAIRQQIPVMQGVLRAVEDGGLMAHGLDDLIAHRRVPYYVDRILRGAKPGDLPVEQPTRIEFHLNLKAAKAIGLRIPQSVVLQADRVVDA